MSASQDSPEHKAATSVGTATGPVPEKPNAFLEIGVTILAPALVLMQLSGPTSLGPVKALLLALAFPLAWGLWDAWRRHAFNWLAALGVISTLLTGGIGLLKLEAGWLAVKEAAVPSLIGLVIMASAWTKTPLIRLMVFNRTLFNVDKVQSALSTSGNVQAFEKCLRTGTLLLAGTFFFSAVANFFLTQWVVTSPAGTEAFNAELGRLTLLSYPLIAIPSMLMMMGMLYWLAKRAKALTGLDIADMLEGK